MTGPDWTERFWAKVDKNGPVPAHRPELGLVGSVSGDRWRGEVAGLDPAAVTVGGLEEQDVPPHGGKLARAVEARDATADNPRPRAHVTPPAQRP